MITFLTGFRIFRAQLEKAFRITATQGETKHCDPIFLLQFLNVLYIADNCAKIEKKSGQYIIFKGLTLTQRKGTSVI